VTSECDTDSEYDYESISMSIALILKFKLFEGLVVVNFKNK